MPHLHAVNENHLARFIGQIRDLKLGKKDGRVRPHKFLLLLTVADLLETSMVTMNRFYYNEQLKTSFTLFYEHYKKRGDYNRPQRPFFHLVSAPFWHHEVKAGREQAYKTMLSDEGPVRANIDYAYLSDEAFKVLSDEDSREQVVEAVHLMVLTKC